MNSGTLRGIPGRRLGRTSEATKAVRGDGSIGDALAASFNPFAAPSIAKYSYPYVAAAIADMACGTGDCVNSPFYGWADAAYDRISVQFHSPTAAGVVYLSVWTWDAELKKPVAPVADIGTVTSFGSPGSYFWYHRTVTFRLPADGWYCLIGRPTGETCTFQSNLALPPAASGGLLNVPGNGFYKSTVSSGATYPTSLTSLGDGVGYVPAIVVRRLM